MKFMLTPTRYGRTLLFQSNNIHYPENEFCLTSFTGEEIVKQFDEGSYLDGESMAIIIDDFTKNTSPLYQTGERVLLSQQFIMV